VEWGRCLGRLDSFNNPIKFIDPSGLWEFNIVEDNEGNKSLQLQQEEDDTWKTFRKQSGLSKKELIATFGEDYKSVLNSTSSLGINDMKGEVGSLLAEIENALTNLNETQPMEGNNCMGCSYSLATEGKINQKLTMGSLGLPPDYDFDGSTLDEFTASSNPKLGDIVRYARDNGGATTHTATFLLNSRDGDKNKAQVFYKSGGDIKSTYELMKENEMLDKYKFGERIGRQKTGQSKEGDTFMFNEGSYYRLKK
jgi:hypothetical protein